MLSGKRLPALIVVMCSICMLGLIALAFATPRLAVVQQEENPCKPILQEGLYKTFNMVRTGSFSQDLKTYLATEIFKRDFKAGKWGGTLAAVVDSVPISLGVNASNDEINTFVQKVSSSTTFSVSDSFYDNFSSRTPDVALAAVYSDCVIRYNENRGYGLKVSGNSTDKSVNFIVTFRRLASGNPAPKVRFVNLRGVTNAMNVPVLGSELPDASVITADRKPDEDAILVLETDQGALTHVIEASAPGYNADLPVGTIVSSYLTWSQFQKVTKNNARDAADLYNPTKSKWCPSDGRAVSGSAFERATGDASVPELRGRFLRGLNRFDPERTPISDTLGDPDGEREKGGFQPDDIKEHSHTYRRWELNAAVVGHTNNGPRYPDIIAMGNPDFNNRTDNSATPRSTTGGPSGRETRPQNVAVYYYIRIN